MPGTRRRGLKTRYQMAVEREYGRPWQEVLSHMLYVRRLTHEEAAKELRVKRSTVSYWVLTLREKEEAQLEPFPLTKPEREAVAVAV